MASKYGNCTLDFCTNLLDKVGGMAGAERILSGQTILTVPRCWWRKHDGIVYFPVISDSLSGREWVTHLTQKHWAVTQKAQALLLSSDFRPEKFLAIVAVLSGRLFADHDRNEPTIRTYAEKRGFFAAPPEVGCISRDMFSDNDFERMGIVSLVTMHNPIRINLEGGDCQTCFLEASAGFTGNLLEVRSNGSFRHSSNGVQFLETDGLAFIGSYLKLS